VSSSYSTWSIAKLKKEAAKIDKAISTKELHERKSAMAEMRAVAKKHGFSLSDLLHEQGGGTPLNGSKPAPVVAAKRSQQKKNATSASKPKTRLTRAKAKIKYRNPGNYNETWTGRGRQPRWVVEFVTKGGELSQLSV